MTSKVDICNLALMRIGQRTVLSLDELTNEASYAKKLYDRTRRTVLRSFTWRFALKTDTLALRDEDSALGYSYVYALPADCVRAVDVVNTYTDTPTEYEIVGQSLHTNESSAVLRYVRDVTDPNEFDDLFVDAFSYRLAAELAQPVTGNGNMQQGMLQMYSQTLAHAQGASASEARKRNKIGSSIRDSRK